VGRVDRRLTCGELSWPVKRADRALNRRCGCSSVLSSCHATFDTASMHANRPSFALYERVRAALPSASDVRLAGLPQPADQARRRALVLGVLRIARQRDLLGEACRAEEQQREQRRADDRWVDDAGASADGEQVERPPDRLLAEEVRVARVAEQPGRDEFGADRLAAVEAGAPAPPGGA